MTSSIIDPKVKLDPAQRKGQFKTHNEKTLLLDSHRFIYATITAVANGQIEKKGGKMCTRT